MALLFHEEGLVNGHYFYHANDGFHYHVSEIREHVIYFKCVKYERGCMGRAKMRAFQRLIHTRPHNHDRDYFYCQEVSLRRRILNLAESRQLVSFRNIINRERMRYPMAVAIRMTSRRLRSQMARRRALRYPPHPETIEEMSALLQSPQYVSVSSSIDDTDCMYAASVCDEDGLQHIIFSTRRMLAFMSSCVILFSDGTFKSTPKVDSVRQVFCITTIWRRHVIPLAWVLMSGKSEAAYISVLRCVRFMIGPCNVQKVITDYESAEQKAWRFIFLVNVQGCLFHYCSALLRKVCELGLKLHLLHNDIVRTIFAWCCALPLLPDQFICLGFYLIGSYTMNHHGVAHALLRSFFAYIHNEWVTHRDRRAGMSVSGSAHRTNNACETSNRWLTYEVGGPHPGPWVFVEGIARIEQNAYVDVMILGEGGNPSRRRRAHYIAQDAGIRSLTRDLRNPPDDLNSAVMRFLRGAARRVEGVIDRGLGMGNIAEVEQ